MEAVCISTKNASGLSSMYCTKQVTWWALPKVGTPENRVINSQLSSPLLNGLLIDFSKIIDSARSETALQIMLNQEPFRARQTGVRHSDNDCRMIARRREMNMGTNNVKLHGSAIGKLFQL